MTEEPFSLLMSVYAGERADFLQRSLTSSVQEQTRRPAQVVIVRDGPVGAELAAVLQDFRDSGLVETTVVELEANRGLGPALQAGLRECRHDVVARQDADDISLPHRFEVQLPLIESGYDLVGSALIEFGDDERVEVGRRTPPTQPDEIAAWARFHDPFNHPTVVYRKAAVDAAGGYQDLPLMEDYWLFVRMLSAGAKAANVAEPLVLYRIGAGAYRRRGGAALLKSEWRLQRMMRTSGFTTPAQRARNVIVRGGYRLVPEPLRRNAYRQWIARRHETRGGTLARPPAKETDG